MVVGDIRGARRACRANRRAEGVPLGGPGHGARRQVERKVGCVGKGDGFGDRGQVSGVPDGWLREARVSCNEDRGRSLRPLQSVVGKTACG